MYVRASNFTRQRARLLRHQADLADLLDPAGDHPCRDHPGDHSHEDGISAKVCAHGIYLILTCAKAFYIIAEFMHLRHEIKNMIMTIAVPACLFIWFIIAFLVGWSFL